MVGEVNAFDGTDRDLLQTILPIASKTHKGFQTCFFNSRSFSGTKRDYMNFVLKSTKIDVICVAETWFNEDYNDSVLELNQYNLIRNDRKTGSRGGGVAMYVRKCFQYKVIFRSDTSDPVEYLFVEIFDSMQKCLIVCVYNPHKSFDLSNFFVKLSEYCVQFKHIILCGDLNIDLSEYDSYSKNLNDKFVSVGLSKINHMPTRFSPNSKPSLLDVLCVADLEYLVHFEQLSLHGISDHDMLFMVYNIDYNRSNNETTVRFRDFKNIDCESLLAEAASLPWNDCWFFSDVDSKVEHFTNLVNYLLINMCQLKF